MSLLDRFKSSKQKDEVNLPPTGIDSEEKDSIQDKDPFADEEVDDPFDTTTNTNPMSQNHSQQGNDDGLRQDVKLVLERLDTVKSQLQSIQHRLDSLESKHEESNKKRW